MTEAIVSNWKSKKYWKKHMATPQAKRETPLRGLEYTLNSSPTQNRKMREK